MAGQGGIGGVGGFGGPSIQGRGGSGGRQQRDTFRIRPFLGVQAIYDSGLTSIRPGTDGSVFSRGAPGVEVVGGLYGTKQWKRNEVQLSYLGDYRHYANNANFNGADQSLNVSYARPISKRIGIQSSLAAGTTNRAFGGIGQISALDAITQPGLPVNSIFDIRTNYGSANGTLGYNLSPRTSLTFSGGGFLVKRQNTAVFGVTGVQARADLARRISRKTSVGIDYNFSTFQFSRAFGDTYVHGGGVFLARKIGRHWELNIRAGAVRLEILATRQVAIDPAIAEIIGVTSGEVVAYSKNILGSGDFSLTRSARGGNLSFLASRSVNPGNGIILTAQLDTAGVSFNRRLSRQLNFDISGNYSRMRGLGLINASFRTINGGVGLGWQVARYTQITARFDRRNAVATGTSSLLNLNGNRFSFGVVFTPADIPVSLW